MVSVYNHHSRDAVRYTHYINDCDPDMKTASTFTFRLPHLCLLIGGHSSCCNCGHNDGNDGRRSACSRGIACSEGDVPTCSTRSDDIRCKRSTASRCTSHSKTLCSLRQASVTFAINTEILEHSIDASLYKISGPF